MIHVEIENIYAEEDAIRQIREIFDRVDRDGEVVVVTRNNHPRIVVIDLEHVESMTGRSVTPVAPLIPSVEASPASDPLPLPAEPLTQDPKLDAQSMPPSAPVMSSAPTMPATASEEVSQDLPPLFPPLPNPSVAAPSGTPAPAASNPSTGMAMPGYSASVPAYPPAQMLDVSPLTDPLPAPDPVPSYSLPTPPMPPMPPQAPASSSPGPVPPATGSMVPTPQVPLPPTPPIPSAPLAPYMPPAAPPTSPTVQVAPMTAVPAPPQIIAPPRIAEDLPDLPLDPTNSSPLA
jgi:prevent-host-death family protein